ncbi:MAG: hypothetical protein QOH31_4443 [Verrucomicrobiota bacterium]|jgi:hypothetical protein
MTQKQREAVVDLLLLGMFADAPLKVSEDQKLLSVIEEIGWHFLSGSRSLSPIRDCPGS